MVGAGAGTMVGAGTGAGTKAGAGTGTGAIPGTPGGVATSLLPATATLLPSTPVRSLTQSSELLGNLKGEPGVVTGENSPIGKGNGAAGGGVGAVTNSLISLDI